MDDELRTHLSETEDRLSKGFAQELTSMEERIEKRFDNKMDESFTRWTQLIFHEMGSRFDKVKNVLESIDSRLKLHAGLLQSGARAMARFSAYAEDSEERWVGLVHRVAEIERKLNAK